MMSALRNQSEKLFFPYCESSSSRTESESEPSNLDEDHIRDQQPPGTASWHAEQSEQLRQQTSLPNSVRGAPSHMRAAIRRRQNKESARRTRSRKAKALQALAERHYAQVALIGTLEQRVQNLTRLLQEAGIPVPDQERVTNVIDVNDDDDQLFKELLEILDDGIVDDPSISKGESDKSQSEQRQ